MGKEYSTDDENAVAMAESYVLYFGAHKNKPLKEVPNGYIRWLSENACNDQVAAFADLLLRYRKKWGIEV